MKTASSTQIYFLPDFPQFKLELENCDHSWIMKKFPALRNDSMYRQASEHFLAKFPEYVLRQPGFLKTQRRDWENPQPGATIIDRLSDDPTQDILYSILAVVSRVDLGEVVEWELLLQKQKLERVQYQERSRT